jgi:hypothetical protein
MSSRKSVQIVMLLYNKLRENLVIFVLLRSSIDGLGPMLQARRSWVRVLIRSLNFFHLT